MVKWTGKEAGCFLMLLKWNFRNPSKDTPASLCPPGLRAKQFVNV